MRAQVAVAGLTRSIALVCTLEATAGAALRIDLDDLNVSLPEFTLPSLDLSTLHLLDMPALSARAGAFSGLSGAAQISARFVQVSAGAPAKLAIRVNWGAIEWALVDTAFVDADWGNLAPKLAKFNATISQDAATVVATINDITLAQAGAQSVFQAALVVGAHAPIKAGKRRLGPLEIAWDDAQLEAVASAGRRQISTKVSFQRLTLRAHDDPDAVLAFAGEVFLSPAGASMAGLRLVEPYPIELVRNVATEIAQGAAPIASAVFDFAAATAEQLARLLGILGKMATAAARSAVIVGEAAGDAGEAALNDAGRLLDKALHGVAELVTALVGKLDALAAAAQDCIVEVRFSTTPFELRQILLTLPPANGAAASALGIHLAVNGGWRPGALIDLVSEPGAYLILAHEGAAADSDVAALSTDLWLNRDGAQSAVRDADHASGGRGEKPLVGVRLKQKAAGQPTIIALAGLSRGRGVFLRRLVGEIAEQPVAGLPFKAMTVKGPIVFDKISEGFDVDVKFEQDRVLPLLGMGEPGNGGGTPDFLKRLQGSLSNVIWVKRTDSKATLGGAAPRAELDLVLGLKAAGVETELTLKVIFNLDTFEASLEGSDVFAIKSRRIEERALGLVWIIEQADEKERLADDPVEMFQLGFDGGQSGFELNRRAARMELRFEGLSSDGRGVVFDVETFKIAAGGLDLKAKVSDNPVKLNGVDVPFRFTTGELEIKAGRLIHASVAGRGSLPPDLIGEADCTIALTFGEEAGGGIVLQSGKVDLDKKGDPIVCHSTRFTLTISDLDIAFVKDGGYHFYYLVTGSLRFSPKSGEFEDGLLKFLDGVELDLERAPLSADPRVLLKHISFQKALNPKKSFNLFNLFDFEIRGFGYHPASPKFDGAPPAVNISGQIKFVEIGDVMQPKIDFHGLWIAPPAKGKTLPRIKADGLGVDLNLKGSIHVRGAVLAVDPGTTVEGGDLAPKGYQAYGFLGEGELAIPGWGDLAASLGFLEIERKENPGARRKSFFFYAEQRQIAVEIPAVIWTFYLRDVGFGFGFRYTLEALRAADDAPSIPKLIAALDDVSKRSGDLHKFSAWRPEADGDRVTLALKGAIQAYPASKTWNEKEEREAENPFLFDLVAAIRSDFTLFMGLRGWLGVNYIDYLNDKDGLRSNPGLRGYLYISAPHKRLLARAIGDSKGYIGDAIPALKKGLDGSDPPLRRALRAVDWSATLFIKPGLFHYELGWPNQLVARLMDEPNMRVTVRGGMIFRAAEDGLLWGYNIEADAFFRFGGSLQIGPVGVVAEASLEAHLVARVICYLSWRFKGSLVYGLMSLDATLAISVRAWLDVDLGLTSFTIRIGFSLSLQFSAAVEIAISTDGIGARANARVAISVFGCTLSVSVGFTIGGGQLDEARRRVQRFLAMSITAEDPDDAPALAVKSGDERVRKDAERASVAAQAPDPEKVVEQPQDKSLKPSKTRAQFGRKILGTDFHLVLRRAVMTPDGKGPAPADYAYALLLPREPTQNDVDADVTSAGFYAAPTKFAANGLRDESVAYHVLRPTQDLSLPNTKIWSPTGDEPGFADLQFVEQPDHTLAHECRVRWSAEVDAEQPQPGFTLAVLFDECFLTDTKWVNATTRVTTAWTEPAARSHAAAAPVAGSTEQERVAARDTAQRARLASEQANPFVEAVHQARSTVLAAFVDQFVAVCENGLPQRRAKAHVSDLGLLFYGPVDELEKLETVSVEKQDYSTGAPLAQTGGVRILNPRETWFDMVDPILAAGRSTFAPDGVKLDWILQQPWSGAAVGAGEQDAPSFEHVLHHYEILRTIEGHEFEPRMIKVKPASTIGECDNGKVRLILPEWQFVDDLADLSAECRRALLPVSDEAQALQAAIDWESAIKEDRATLTYSVTPVDVAGARGLPKSFLVERNRPNVPVRPAEAELRFIVSRMGDADAKPHTQAGRPKNAPNQPALCVMMALRDPFRSNDILKNLTVDYAVARNYLLFADPEDIRPSGHYGSDGLTDRRLGPPSGVVPSADEICWIVNFADGDTKLFDDMRDNGKLVDNPSVAWIEPDRDALEKFPMWRRLAGDVGAVQRAGLMAVHPPSRKDASPSADDFLDSLWSRDGGKRRIATRFSLQTAHMIYDVRNPKQPKLVATSFSKRTPVAIEVRIERAARWDAKGNSKPLDSSTEISLMRPEAFEWPVHLDLPPHISGQVRAESGFARFKVPPAAGASLADLLNGANTVLVRDPERRVLTQIAFAAGATLGPKCATGVDAVHASSIAGYDLHELDLDDLARLDTTGAALGRDAKSWRRARRVARIERVSPQMARLTPDNNRDWQGWQAHYPSETWRLLNRGAGRQGQSQPIRAPWYSAAESTLRFAERAPRLRLLPTAPEGAVADLMREGSPSLLKCTLNLPGAAPDADAVQLAYLELGRFGALAADLAVIDTPKGKMFGLSGWDAAEAPLTPALIRAALLRLGWTPTKTIKDRFADNPGALDGAVLTIEGFACKRNWKGETQRDGNNQLELRSTGVASETLTFGTFRHGLLEEVLGELEYAAAADDDNTLSALYRRYVVTAQSVLPSDSQDLARFLASTSPEKDPYGWAALQQLGLATTLRLYDRDEDCFVSARDLLRRIEPALRNAFKRYVEAYGWAREWPPIIEVLLKPTRDRVAGPFDAVQQPDGSEPESGAVDLDDDALAMAQISLRPQAAPVWTYQRVEAKWTKGDWPAPRFASPSGEKTLAILGYELCFSTPPEDKPPYEALRVADGRLIVAGTASMPAISWPRGAIDDPKADPGLVFYIRSMGGFDVGPFKQFKMKARIAVETRGAAPAQAGAEQTPVKRDEKIVEFAELKDAIKDVTGAAPDGFPDTPEAVASAPSPRPRPAGEGASPSPYGLFKEIDALHWSAVAATPEDPNRDTPAAPFLSLWRNLRHALPKFDWPPQPASGAPSTPTSADYAKVMGTYLAWSQRMLDHGPIERKIDAQAGAGEPAIPFALAAPIKAHPWQLAADSRGMITLSFLHADRWAHARAYAVRPTPRYQNLALGAGYFADPQDSERLVTPSLMNGEDFKAEVDIGYALAVSSRTEKIEPPVILGSSLTPEGAWSLVLARHGEESLAFSNRPLFARLETQGVALAFVRQHREPAWPGKLKSAGGAAWPDAVLHPTREVVAPAAPARNSEIDGATLRDLARRHPSLWKGADVRIIDPLPPHYRVTALAVARAGVVVSSVVSATHDPRRFDLKNRDALLGQPEIAIRRVQGADYVLALQKVRLVSYADVTPDNAAAWIGTGEAPVDDIAWWPDPGVRYTLLREGAGGPTPYQEEDAVIDLAAGEEATAPVVLRCRGTRFDAAATLATIAASQGQWERRAGLPCRNFQLDLPLAPRKDGPIDPKAAQWARMPSATDNERKAFNSHADGKFAAICAERNVSIKVQFDDGMDAAQARTRLDDAARALSDAADALHAAGKHAFDNDAEAWSAALRAAAAALKAEAAGLTAPPNLPDLGRTRPVVVALRDAGANLPAVGAPGDGAPKLVTIEAGAANGVDALVVFGLPEDGEATSVLDAHPFSKPGGAFWRLSRERLMGAASKFRLRAVDGRNAATFVGGPDARRLDAVGEITVDVKSPPWTEYASGGQ
ncbi:hypothetical protein [Methylocella sp.]|uniref:hypothetical protein n=1 Tax=Methylocella sp. TaxID=1978226 RepID=UPI003783B3EA